MGQQQGKQGKSNAHVRWIRIGITLVALLFIVIGGILTIQGSLQGSTILTVLGVMMGLFQWLFPFSTEKEDQKHAKVSSTHEISVPTNKEQQITVLPPQPIWNVPYQRNPFFSNRANVLTTIHNALTTGKEGFTTPQALSGLGGIGKTQIAIEYAYCYRDEYQAIFWANADSQSTLISDCTIIADALGLPEKSEKDQQRVIGAVKRWLQQHEHWLLILDNANDFTVVDAILPIASKGHILLTTQAYALGARARKIEIEKFNPEEGALLLLRRTRLVTQNHMLGRIPNSDMIEAKVISQLVDGLPLALDQAGAYIEETVCGINGYLNLYRQHSANLLQQRGRVADHRASVTTTWALAFKKIRQRNPAAIELLYLCAFLHPDAIPELLIISGASFLGSVLQKAVEAPLEWNEVIREILAFSLLKREPSSKTLSIHRVIQEVLRNAMDEQEQQQWAERAVRIVNKAFSRVDFTTWSYCQQCLPHVQVCIKNIEQWHMTFEEVPRLLQQTGTYLHDRAQYNEAVPLVQQSLILLERTLGSEHPDVATSLVGLARLYHDQGKYSQAELLLQRALTIREHKLQGDHPDIAQSLTSLALLYWDQGKYAQAEPYLKRALAIQEKILGPEHLDVAASSNVLGLVYDEQGKYSQAEVSYQRALAIREKVLGMEHPTIAESLNNLAYLYNVQGKYTQAEALYQRALTIRKKSLRPDHPTIATSLNNLAKFYLDRGQYVLAESLLQQALTIREKMLGPEHSRIASVLNNLGELALLQAKYEQAEEFCLHALAIREKALGQEHPYLIPILNNLAAIYIQKHQYGQAEVLLRRALGIGEQALGPGHLHLTPSLDNLAVLYENQGRYDQMETLLQRSLTIRKNMLGPEHPDTVKSTEKYITFLRKMKRKQEAKELEIQLKEIKRKSHS